MIKHSCCLCFFNRSCQWWCGHSKSHLDHNWVLHIFLLIAFVCSHPTLILSAIYNTYMLNILLTLGAHTVLVNPRRACARVTVLVLSVSLSVCVCVCFPYSGTSRNQTYKQQYQRLQRDTGMKYKKGFFFKTLRSEVMASFTHLE